MTILTEDLINERAVELFAEASKIQNKELKKVAEDYTKNKIQQMREAAVVFEDDEFWYELIGQAEGDEIFMAKVELLKQCLL